MSGKLSDYERIDFEEAARIIYFMFCRNDKIYKQIMEELLITGFPIYKVIAPAWHESYRQHLEDNKKEK